MPVSTSKAKGVARMLGVCLRCQSVAESYPLVLYIHLYEPNYLIGLLPVFLVCGSSCFVYHRCFFFPTLLGAHAVYTLGLYMHQ